MTSRALSAAAVAALSIFIVSLDPAAAQIAPQPVPSPALGLQEQGQPPQGQPPAPAAEPAPQPTESPGLFNQMGKMFEKSLSALPSLKSTGEAIDNLGTRAKEATKGAEDALSRLAKPGSMVSGRVLCPGAANGPPDCKAAADWLCKTKGYKEGNSLNTDSAQKCSAKVMIPGRQRQASDCHTDNFVTTALCQ